MKASTLPDAAAPAAAYGSGLAVKPRRGFGEPTADYGNVNPGARWWFTIEGLFCRAFPDLSQWLYDVLGEDVANELDD